MIGLLIFWSFWMFCAGFVFGVRIWPSLRQWVRDKYDRMRPPANVIYEDRIIREPFSIAEKRKEVAAMKRDIRSLLKVLPKDEHEMVLRDIIPKLVWHLDALLRREEEDL